MTKTKIEPGPFALPMPVALVGAETDGKANFMPAAFMGIVNYKPAMIACGLSANHHTCKGMEMNKTFSLNIPTVSQAQITDYCGLVSGAKEDKSGLFAVFNGELKGAPMIEDFPLTMELKLVSAAPLGVDTLYVGEIVSVFVTDECLTDGKPDWDKINPLLFTFPDSMYRRLGESVAKAWSAGKGFNPKK